MMKLKISPKCMKWTAQKFFQSISHPPFTGFKFHFVLHEFSDRCEIDIVFRYFLDWDSYLLRGIDLLSLESCTYIRAARASYTDIFLGTHQINVTQLARVSINSRVGTPCLARDSPCEIGKSIPVDVTSLFLSYRVIFRANIFLRSDRYVADLCP